MGRSTRSWELRRERTAVEKAGGVILGLASLLASSCPGRPAEPELPRPTRGYLLVSFDTLRADHLGAYGYERDTSPFFDRLAARGTLFAQAIVQYPSTLTSHMSMLTGLYPLEHGVYPPDAVLPPEIETVAEVFQRHGFRTAAHTEGGYVRGRYGFRRGFDEFRARDRRGPREIERTFARGVRFLEGLGPEDRFFLFLHTYAVHAPYRPPEGYQDLFWPGEPPPGAFPPTGPLLARHNVEGGTLSPEVLAYFSALYDATIRHADDALRDLFAELDRLGLAGDVTVILTSDHGEELQEHGRMNHEQLYQEVMRVPLLVLHPDRRSPVRHRLPVESVDLAATLYELAGIEPRQSPSGESLARWIGQPRGVAGVGEGEAYAEVASGVKALWLREGPGDAAGQGDGREAGRLLHLLLHEPDEGRWVSRRLPVETSNVRLGFEARSYGEPRELTVRRRPADGGVGEIVGTFPLGTDWTPVEIALGMTAGKHRLELSVPGCTVPAEATARRWQCRGFQVRGIPLVRLELYDPVTDPREARDLSAELEGRTRALLRRLVERRFAPRAEARVEALDPETEAQLQALGYLQ